MAVTSTTDYYAGCNITLLKAVPDRALRILEVGCAEARLGAALKSINPLRYVTGIELQPQAASVAAKQIDRVLVMDIEKESPEIEPGSMDCILFGDVLEHLIQPGAVLERFKKFLAPEGAVLCSLPNFQHYSVLATLLANDFQYTSAGLLDATHLRFFTVSSMQKMFLDAGYEPHLVNTIDVPVPLGFMEAAKPLLDALGLDSARTQKYLQAYQCIWEGRPMPPVPEEPAELLSIVACVSDEAALHANLLASPDLKNTRHEIILVRNCRNAAEGLNKGLDMAKNSLVVFAHQDVYLPKGWANRVIRQYRDAEKTMGAIGIAGVFGVVDHGGLFSRVGHVVDRDSVLQGSTPLPARVSSLDELVLVVPKATPIRFDPALGFHFYGSDFCLSAKAKELPAVVLDALCFHNSRTAGLNAAFGQSAAVFLSKWKQQLPLATPCVLFTPAGEMQVW